MSFLNSVLSSIGGAVPAPASSAPNVSKINSATSNTQHTTFKTSTSGAPTLKRSSEGDHPSQPPSKTVRTDVQAISTAPSARNGASGIFTALPARSSTSSASSRQPSPSKSLSNSAKHSLVQTSSRTIVAQTASPSPGKTTTIIASTSRTLPHRGLSSPAVRTVSSVPVARPVNLEKQSASSKSIPAAAAATTTAATATTAKKGSYREIMERAQAAKTSQAALGQITHKAVPKLSKREKLAQEAEAAQKAKEAVRGKIVNKGERVVGAGRPVAKVSEPVKEKKSPLDLGYKGTMRPIGKEPVYKGTAKPIPSYNGTQRTTISKRPPEERSAGPTQDRYKYASYSDEEEEESYLSDASEDMEVAGFGELDDEEEASLRQARKDDAAERKLEDDLKEQKRKRLQALAAATAARRARY